jgi:hypothetical protein
MTKSKYPVYCPDCGEQTTPTKDSKYHCYTENCSVVFVKKRPYVYNRKHIPTINKIVRVSMGVRNDVMSRV